MVERRALRRFLIVYALLATTSAHAQTASKDVRNGDVDPQTRVDQEIVVTATRRNQSLQDVPLSVDVVGGEALEKFNLFDFKDVQALTPGLQLTNNDGRSNSATLRGITFDPDSGSSPAVDTFFNEIPLDPQTAFTSIYDVGQIEVLRGPQGLFRGRTAPAGSITLTTRKPNLSVPEGYAQLTGSSLAAVNFQAAASLPLKDDVLAVRAAMLIDENRANQVRNVDGERSRSSTQSGRLSLAYRPSANFRGDLTYQYLQSDVRPFIAVFGPGNQPSLLDPSRSGPAVTLEDRRSVTELAPRFQNTTHLVTAQLEYDFGGAALFYNGGYQNTELNQFRDQDSGNAVPNYSLPQTTKIPYRVWSNEVRLQSRGDTRFTWFVAGNYNKQTSPVSFVQRNDQFLGLAFTPLPPSLAVVPVFVDGAVNIDVVNYSFAGSAGYELVRGLTLTMGVRHTWYDTDRTQITSVGVAGGPPSISTSVSNKRSRYFTGGASLSYEISPEVTTYASYGRSARPGVVAVGVSVPLAARYLETPDETSNAGEIGIKTSLFGKRVTLNADIFYQKFKNYLGYENCLTSNTSGVAGLTDTSCAPLPTYGNAVSKGAEIQLTARPTNFFDFGISASYADAHYDNAKVYCNDYNGDSRPDSNGSPFVPGTAQIATCIRNDRLAQIPKVNLSGNAEIRQPLGALQGFVRTLVTYRPGFFSTADNYQYRDLTNVNLFLGLRGPNSVWELSVFAKNLLDQTRASRVSQGIAQYGTTDYTVFPPAAAAPFSSGYRTAVINPPREFGATLSFKW